MVHCPSKERRSVLPRRILVATKQPRSRYFAEKGKSAAASAPLYSFQDVSLDRGNCQERLKTRQNNVTVAV